MKVDFFIVGTPKAGTTSLYYYLDDHPQIIMSSIKEPNYFSNQDISLQNLFYEETIIESLEDYHKLFPEDKTVKKYGESSVSYLFYKSVPKKIYQYNKRSKIIILLRNPIERAYSHYLMDRRLGLVNQEFSDIFEKKSGIFFQQYFKLGNYTNQIKRYIDIFQEDNIHIIWYDKFKEDVAQEVSKVYQFLSVDQDFKFNLNREYNKSLITNNKIVLAIYSVRSLRKILKRIFSVKFMIFIKTLFFQRNNKPELSKSLKKELIEYYYEDILSLEKLLKKDLRDWKR